MAKGAPEPQGGGGGGDRSLDFLWVIVMLMGAVFLTWYFGKIYIGMAIFKIRQYEIYAITFVANFIIIPAKLLHLPTSFQGVQTLNEWTAFIRQNYGSAVDFDVLAKLSTDVGSYIRFFSAPVLVLLSIILFTSGAAQRFRNTFDMKRLRITEQQNWPQIIPVVKIDLISEDIDKGPWAMALPPMKFCKKNDLLNVEIKDGKPLVTLKRGAAYRTVSLQLGPRWLGFNALPIHLKALAAVFAARIDGDRKSGEVLLDQIAQTAADGVDKLNFSGAEELLAKHMNAKKVQKIVSIHGYVATALASLLATSREAGVMATSEFIWLKPLDRRMWYMLNSVGRTTAVAEISGAFAHWLSEKKLGLPLMVPMVDEAVRGLEVALTDIIYKPDED